MTSAKYPKPFQNVFWLLTSSGGALHGSFDKE